MLESPVSIYFYTSDVLLYYNMSNWNEEVFETLSRLDANSNENQRNSLAASVTTPENDQLRASSIERY